MNLKNKYIVSISAIVMMCVGGAYTLMVYNSQQSRELGKVEAENSFIKEQLAQSRLDVTSLRDENKRLVSADIARQIESDKLRQTIDYRDRELADANQKIASLLQQVASYSSTLKENARCDVYRTDISKLQEELAGRGQFVWSAAPNQSRKEEIMSLLAQAHKPLDSCLSGKTL